MIDEIHLGLTYNIAIPLRLICIMQPIANPIDVTRNEGFDGEFCPYLIKIGSWLTAELSRFEGNHRDVWRSPSLNS